MISAPSGLEGATHLVYSRYSTQEAITVDLREGSPPRLCTWPLPQPKATTPSPGLEATLQERLALYQTAIESARQAGDSAKMRRYDRGLKVSGQTRG